MSDLIQAVLCQIDKKKKMVADDVRKKKNQAKEIIRRMRDEG